MASALEGIRVVDFSRGFPGTLAAMVLADNGAEVVRVEPPSGDPERAMAAYPMWRRGQKSVTVDLRDEAGRRQAAALAAGADVVLQNWRPGVAERLGLGYDELAGRNPGLVYCEITGFGPKGRYAGVKAYEGIVGARAGRFVRSGRPFGRDGRVSPLFLASPHASFGAAQTALQGIFAALYVRGRCGRGQRVSTSLVQGLTVFDIQAWIIDYFADEGAGGVQAYAEDAPDGTPMTPYFYWLLIARTKDGRWFQFANVMPHLWSAFLKATELEHIYEDPDWKTAPIFQSPAAASRFWDLLQDRIGSKTADEWMEIFLTDSNIAAEILRTTQDAKNHPQMRINGHVVDVVDPDVGPMEQVGPLVTFWETPATITAGAPPLGRDNALLAGGAKAPMASTNAAPAHPLEGVTVLDIGTWFAAPFGVTLMAELGARVIKVEQLDGDPYRYGMPTPELFSLKAIQGKESIAVDFRTEEGRRIVYELAKTADMAMCSFRQGVAAQFGVDYESLRKVNPKIIYHHGVSYGLEGEFPKRPVFGPIPPSIVGEPLFQVGQGNVPAEDEPFDRDAYRDTVSKLSATVAGLGDAIGALGVGTGMLLGLLARERTGLGQQSMTTMIGSAAYMMSDDFVWYDGKPARRLPDKELYGFDALYRMYETSEGWVFLACPAPDEWEPLCDAMKAATAGAVSLGGDPRFESVEARAANDAALADILAHAFKGQSAAEWERHMLAADVACVQLNQTTLSRFTLRDPDMVENGFVNEQQHFSLGRHLRHGLTVSMSLTPGVIKPASGIGQQTVAILHELGYTDDKIQELHDAKVVRIGAAVAASRTW